MSAKPLREITYPMLTLKERDRRFELTRKFMDTHGLDVLVLTGGGGRILRHWCINQFYLSNEPDGQGAIVVFPRHSPPVLFLLRTQWGSVQHFVNIGIEPWIADFRLSEPGSVECISSVLRDRKLQNGRAGVVSAAGEGRFGSLAEPLWQAVQAQFPGLKSIDVAAAFTVATLAKSDEELELARAAGRAAENAGAALVDAAGEGVSEIELYAAAAEQFARGGVDDYVFMMVVADEMAGLGYGQPRWLFPHRQPRKLKAGDVVMAEFFPVYGGIDTQMQVCLSVGEPSKRTRHIADVTRASYDAGVAALKPGVTFESVWKAMQEPVFAAGCWDWDPFVHSLPMQLLGPMHTKLKGRTDVHESLRNLEAWPAPNAGNAVILEKGMLFAVEPGAALGDDRILLGNLCAVTKDGSEELTTFGSKLHVV